MAKTGSENKRDKRDKRDKRKEEKRNNSPLFRRSSIIFIDESEQIIYTEWQELMGDIGWELG